MMNYSRKVTEKWLFHFARSDIVNNKKEVFG